MLLLLLLLLPLLLLLAKRPCGSSSVVRVNVDWPPVIPGPNIRRDIPDEQVDTRNKQDNPDESLERPPWVNMSRRTPRGWTEAAFDWFVIVILLPHFFVTKEERLHRISWARAGAGRKFDVEGIGASRWRLCPGRFTSRVALRWWTAAAALL